jgi:hypothetical protein
MLQMLLTGCLFGGLGDNCDCPRTPDQPEPQPPLVIGSAIAWTGAGEPDPSTPSDPLGGTIEVTGDRLIVRYPKNGEPRVVVYDVSSHF